MLHTLAAQCPELVQNPGAAVHRLACSINEYIQIILRIILLIIIIILII